MRRQYRLFDLAGGELCTDVREVLAGTVVALFVDLMAGKAAGLAEDGAAGREFGSLAAACPAHRRRVGISSPSEVGTESPRMNITFLTPG